MITVLPETDERLLAIKVSGIFNNEDFDIYRNFIRQRMISSEEAVLYFEMENFNGWEAGSFLENAVFDLIHRNEYGRVAMVGDKEWQHWAAKLASIVKKKGVKYFNLSEKHLAMKWVKNDR